MLELKNLRVWQQSISLVEAVYVVTAEFPPDERYGLTSQLRRAAVSIPSNIAEGYGRPHRADYARHIGIARGSLAELQTQLVIAGRLKFVPRNKLAAVWKQSESIGKMLTNLLDKLTA